MRYANGWKLIGLIMVGLQLAACGSPPPPEPESSPAIIEPIEGTDLNRVILTEDGVHRIGIVTVAVRATQVSGAAREIIPYDAVLYDAQGTAWTYTNPAPLTYVRHQIEVDSIANDMAVIADDLPPDTTVVTVGASELFGAEFEFGE